MAYKLSLKGNNIKHLEDNIGGYLHDLRLRQGFLNKTHIALAIEEMIDKLEYIVKNFSLLKKKTHLKMSEKTRCIMGKDICKHYFIISQSLWNRNLGMT